MNSVAPPRTPPVMTLLPRLIGCAAALTLAGCQTAPPGADRTTVAAQLVSRTGQTLPDFTIPGQFALPPGASFDDGLTEDEALAIALWNNAAFQELLADLGVARGDLIQAGLLPNPEVLYFFNVPNKPFKYALEFPLEALWLRPVRVASAAAESARVADRLAQAGLDLMRDVRQAYADVLLAKARLEVAKKTVELRNDIRGFAEKRLKNGDISEQEAATARIDALQGEQDATRAAFDVPIAEERLRNLLGMGPLRAPLALDPTPLPPPLNASADQLAADAMATRPDAAAAAKAVAAAEERVRLAKLGWVRFLGVLDASSGRATGHEFGPAFRVTLPIFNQNQGGIARAEAELDRARRNQLTVANQIVLDVQRAYLQYQQATAELNALKTTVRPEVEAAIGRSRAAYQEGNVAIFIVLETTRQLLDNYLREAVLNGDLRRTWAELERSVGRKLAAPPVVARVPNANVPFTPPPPPATPDDPPPPAKPVDPMKPATMPPKPVRVDPPLPVIPSIPPPAGNAP